MIPYDAYPNGSHETSNKVPRNSNGTLTFQVSAESRESRVNTLVTESHAMIDGGEADDYVAKLQKLASYNNVMVQNQQEDVSKVYIAKINKYKRKLKKYLQKNKELQTDLECTNQQLERTQK